MNSSAQITPSAADVIAHLHEFIPRKIGDAGKILDIDVWINDNNDGWTVIVDTEYAALKLAHVYRHSDVRMGRAPNRGGWFVTLESRW